MPDTANHRVLIFNTIPTGTGTNNASVVIGQPGFGTATRNNILSTTPIGDAADEASLNNPTAVFVDRGRMYIIDSGNHRILVYNSVPTTNHVKADFVIGQVDFKTIGANHGNTFNTNPRQSLNNPQGIWVTGNRLLVADSGNHRILVFNVNLIGANPVGSNDPLAIGVAGQPNFTTVGKGTTQGSGVSALSNPVDVASNNGANIVVADQNNHRVLIWNTIPTGGTSAGAASSVLGQTSANFTDNQSNRGLKPGNDSMNGPGGVFANPSHLLIGDTNNNRVLRFTGR